MANNSFSARINDLPISFGMRRLVDSENNALWRFSVSRLPGTKDAAFDVDAEISSLLAMRLFIDKAIHAVTTDGDRMATEAMAVGLENDHGA